MRELVSRTVLLTQKMQVPLVHFTNMLVLQQGDAHKDRFHLATNTKQSVLDDERDGKLAMDAALRPLPHPVYRRVRALRMSRQLSRLLLSAGRTVYPVSCYTAATACIYQRTVAACFLDPPLILLSFSLCRSLTFPCTLTFTKFKPLPSIPWLQTSFSCCVQRVLAAACAGRLKRCSEISERSP